MNDKQNAAVQPKLEPTAQEREIQELRAAIADREKKLAERETKIRNLTAELSTAERETMDLRRTVAQRDETIYTLRGQVAQLSNRVSDLTSQRNAVGGLAVFAGLGLLAKTLSEE